jgi:imidazolonepropionase-like amidohydrolase
LDQTVVISNRRVAAVGPAARINIPANAFQISGKNKFLLPGLADMHVHLPYNQDDVKDTPALLQLFVVNGVTTVLNLLGLPNHLKLRDRIDKGIEFGPVIFTSGFYINEPFVA